MTFDLKTALKYLLLFSLGVGILYLAFRGQDLRSLWWEIKSADYFWVLASMAAVLAAHVLRALRWQLLYQSMKYNIGINNIYHAVMIGYLANLALPRFGEIGRCSVIHKTNKVPMFVSIGTVITERLFDMGMLLASATCITFFQYDKLSSFFQKILVENIRDRFDHISYWWFLAVLLIMVVLGGFVFYLLRQKVGRKLLKLFISLRQGFSSYKKLNQKGIFWIYTLSIWFFYILSMYTCFFALQSTAQLGVGVAATAIVFSGFAMAAPVQGGIGVFHWMVAQSLVLYTVPFKDGLAYAAIIHSSQVLLVLVLGSVSLIMVLTRKQI
ncbi:lysylphosphatidylglycerol synthase transmembrane domain-containing protein [Pedobacter frigidisoli]|uniref:lysylphosphatidylglycerol synthase transmembrane domain-containing protein n=1 Tax=Pedobacter frigidisoli TaxID=2530455 RepID=UPI00292E9BE8|nr:lysylphosphatidylglycerol synthase transmembrane domain-containing protein [Pedobacter frigidisoli]